MCSTGTQHHTRTPVTFCIACTAPAGSSKGRHCLASKASASKHSQLAAATGGSNSGPTGRTGRVAAAPALAPPAPAPASLAPAPAPPAAVTALPARQHPQQLQAAAGAAGGNRRGDSRPQWPGAALGCSLQGSAVSGSSHMRTVTCRTSRVCQQLVMHFGQCSAGGFLQLPCQHSIKCYAMLCCVALCYPMLCCQDTRVAQLWPLPLPQGHVPQVCTGEQRLLPSQDPGPAGWHMRAQAHPRLPGGCMHS